MMVGEGPERETAEKNGSRSGHDGQSIIPGAK